MHFTTQALVALLGASLALAAPTQASDYKESCKKEFDKVWNSHDDKWWKKEKTFYFDTEYVVKATPDQVIANSGVPTPGEHGARGLFKYGINIAENVICYNITLSGVTGQYQSPAITATHIHEGVKGKPGPPRLVSMALLKFHSTHIPGNKQYLLIGSRPSLTQLVPTTVAILLDA